MEVAYLYTKVRTEFGKHCGSFADVDAALFEPVPATEEYEDKYIKQNPSVANLDTTPHMCVLSQMRLSQLLFE